VFCHGLASCVINAAANYAQSSSAILKYADDTYLIIPAGNIQSRAAELQNVEEWSQVDNLKLNQAKTQEVIKLLTARARTNLYTLQPRCYQE